MAQWYHLLLGVAAATATPTYAQLPPNPPYDGRPTFVRLKYDAVSSPSQCNVSDSPAGAGWGHDYPMSVQGLMKAATELTSVTAPADSSMVLTATDPELLRYPIAMVTEPGCWDPSDVEAKALGNYLRKGGFLIVDDFAISDGTPEMFELSSQRFEAWMRRVLPEARIVSIPETHPIFDGFFHVNPQEVRDFVGVDRAEFRGVYEGNDPDRRLMVVANYSNAMGHVMRFTGDGLGSGIEQGGQAYQLMLNYLIYGLSH